MAMKNLYAKILAVMKDVEYLKKDDEVKAGYSSYKAITEEKVTSAVGDSMRRHGLVIFPINIEERREDMEVERTSGKTALDRLTTVRITYKIADVETGEAETLMSVGTGIDTQDKGVGKAMTYAYKYALLRTFAIPTGEDPDKVASDDVKPIKSHVTARQPDELVTENDYDTITNKQMGELNALCLTDKKLDQGKVDILSKICDKFGYTNAMQIKRSHYDEIKQAFKQELDELFALPFEL